MAPPSPRPGSSLLVPGRSARLGTALRVLAVPALLAAVATASAPGLLHLGGSSPHTVVVGDTLWDLAQRSGVTVTRLKQLNHLVSDTIVLGELLQLPGAGAPSPTSTTLVGGTTTATTTTTTTTTATAGNAPREHVVVAGDTLTSICASTGSSPAAVRTLNHLPADGTVFLGSTLQLPPAATASLTPTTIGSATTEVAPTTSTPQPAGVTSSSAIRSMVYAEAARQGVPTDLAQAIAYQESGFHQGVVSSTGAIGVMQLMPATAAWIGPAALGRTIDRYNLADNIAGGVAYLRVLLRVVDAHTTIAAYYEGLAQLHARGELPDTRAYVASVTALRARFS